MPRHFARTALFTALSLLIAAGAMAQSGATASPEIQELVQEVRELAMAEKVDEALELIEEQLEDNADHPALVIMGTQLYFQKGIRMAESDREAANEPLMKGVKLMRAYAEGKDELNAQEQQMLALAVYNEACCRAVDGETDGAIESLTEAMELGFDDKSQIRGDSDFDSIRDDARFQKLVAKSRPAMDDDDDDDDDDHDHDHDDDDHDHGDHDDDGHDDDGQPQATS